MADRPNGGASREFDVLLFGATGFVGKLVAEYLVKKRPAVRWALAARSRDRLEAVRADLERIDPAARDLPLVVGDALDSRAVDEMVRRARVVCTTVGPYARYGRALVAACAEQGVDYCDLTGEVLFMRETIDACHARAVASGARIVHTCGFDSIPFDLGVFLVHDHFRKAGDRLAEAHGRLVAMKGGVSGGTLASALDTAEKFGDPAVRRLLANPYALVPDATGGPRQHEVRAPERDGDTGHWIAPFVMAAVNTRVVHRSNRLLDHAYGDDFRYDEATDTGAGPAGLAKAALTTAGVGGAMLAIGLGPSRRLVTRFLPKPGEGPSRATRESGFFRVAIRGTSARGARAEGLVVGTADPGYGETAKMLGESALCLAEDALPKRGGVTTPAAAMGMHLVERLRAAGMTWRVS